MSESTPPTLPPGAAVPEGTSPGAIPPGPQGPPGAARPGPPPEARRPKGSIPIAVIDGVEIEMHWSFLLLVALVVFLEFPGGGHAIAEGLMWILIVFGSVIVHEFAHCIVARRRGGTVLGILLLPIGGMSRLERIPDSPVDEFAISVVGPATSLVVAVLLGLIGALTGGHLWPPTLTTGSWLIRIGWLNLLLGGFNLLPAIPMDGGRILRSLLALHHDRVWATLRATTVARFLAIAMIVVGVLYDFWLILIGLFVLLGANAEAMEAQERDKNRSKTP